jgi:protein SCO1
MRATVTKIGVAQGYRVLLTVLLLIGQMLLSQAGGGSADAADAPGQPMPSISFIDQTGRPVSTKDLLGKPALLFFGFTSCASICPTMLNDVALRMADIGPLADHMNFIFVSVDPERDTPEILRDYLGSFDKRIVGLTGDQSGVAALAKAVGAKFQKVPAEGGSYTVDHSVMAFLMDRDWRRTGILVLGPGTDEKRANERLRAMLAQAEH